MTDDIKVLVVDDIAETRDYIAKLLAIEPDMQVVGSVASGSEAVDIAARLQPDVVLMDLNMPGMGGIEATELLSKRSPATAIVIMSVQGESDYIRRSMLAGAQGFLVKPFSSDELFESLRQVHARGRDRQARLAPIGPGLSSQPIGTDEHVGRVVAVFSPKGGVGRTTLAVNFAVAASGLHRSVALVDANLQFGDVGVLLDLKSKNASIGDIVADIADGAVEAVDGALVKHTTGVDVLLAPPSPETAELVTAEHQRAIIQRLKKTHDLVVVDCLPQLHDQTLAVLDAADVVLCVLTLDITSIKSMRLFVAVASRLGYDDKLRIVLNRADSAHGIEFDDVERSVGRKIDDTVVSDGRAVLHALNHGVPFVAANKRAQVSEDIVAIARAVALEPVPVPLEIEPKPTAERRLIFARR